MNSVSLSVCDRFNSHKYSSNASKFMYVFHVRYSMIPVRKQKKNSNTLWPMGEGEFLQRILTHLYRTKYNKINIGDSNVQTRISCAESFNFFLIYYGLRLETVGNIFLCAYDKKCSRKYFRK